MAVRGRSRSAGRASLSGRATSGFIKPIAVDDTMMKSDNSHSVLSQTVRVGLAP